MPEFAVPADASIAAAHAWFGKADLFRPDEGSAVLNAASVAEPLVIAMIAAWTAWCRAEGYAVPPSTDSLGVAQVRTQRESTAALESISAQLNLQPDDDSLAAIRFCLSELTRNVLEHANSADGAFVAARRFVDSERVAIAVADCGQGVSAHIARAHPEVVDDLTALGMAMRPGVTGAQANAYGTPDNAGAGLYITRSIAKASGGSFFLASGSAAYRVRRARSEDDMMELFIDSFDDPQADYWTPNFSWIGTVASAEIRTDTIAHYENLVEWVLKQVPSRRTGHRRIRFT